MKIIEKIYAFRHDHLLRNSFFFLMTTVVMAGFGFIFWLIAARLFSPSEIGIATSLISSMTLISYISLLGFNSTFVRVLPTSKSRNEIINTGMILSISSAIVLSFIYILLVPYIVPKLSIVNHNIFYALSFVAMVALASINSLTDSIFIAFRSAKYNLLIDGFVLGGTKVFLPFLFVSLGAYGIFAASGAAASLAMIVSITLLIRKFAFKPRIQVHLPSLRSVFPYLSTVYIANLFDMIPSLVLPLIVLNSLGSAATGHYYLAFVVASLLYAIVHAVASSLFVEGSYDREKLRKLFKRAVTILAAVMVPATAFLIFAGPFILSIFGKSYSDEASHTIVVLALSVPFVGVYALGDVILRVKNKTYANILVNAVYVTSVCGLAVLWAERGLVWVAYAWMAGNLIAGIAAFLAIVFSDYHREVKLPL
jgi:O-antigen/teichoic acid export membrane protein